MSPSLLLTGARESVNTRAGGRVSIAEPRIRRKIVTDCFLLIFLPQEPKMTRSKLKEVVEKGVVGVVLLFLVFSFHLVNKV